MKPSHLATSRDGLATVAGEPGSRSAGAGNAAKGDERSSSEARDDTDDTVGAVGPAARNVRTPVSSPDVTVLVVPSAVAPLVRERLGSVSKLIVIGSDAFHPGQLPRADLCIVDESVGDTPGGVRDLTERLGLRVIAIGDRHPSSPEALRCIDEGADDYLSVRRPLRNGRRACTR